MKEAKESKKKAKKDEAIQKAVTVLEKLKKKSDSAVSVMETLQDRNQQLKGRVEKIKKEVGVMESLFNTPTTKPFMYGPYF